MSGLERWRSGHPALVTGSREIISPQQELVSKSNITKLPVLIACCCILALVVGKLRTTPFVTHLAPHSEEEHQEVGLDGGVQQTLGAPWWPVWEESGLLALEWDLLAESPFIRYSTRAPPETSLPPGLPDSRPWPWLQSSAQPGLGGCPTAIGLALSSIPGQSKGRALPGVGQRLHPTWPPTCPPTVPTENTSLPHGASLARVVPAAWIACFHGTQWPKK